MNTKYKKTVAVPLLLALTACSPKVTNEASQTQQKVTPPEKKRFVKVVEEVKPEQPALHTKNTPKNLFFSLNDVKNSKFVHRMDEGTKVPNESTKIKKRRNVWKDIATHFQFYEAHQQYPTVSRYIHDILAKPDTFSIMTLNSAPYITFVYEQIKKRQMPAELALLPIVESGYLPKAVSHRGATGLWQFTRGTGKYYGLPQNWWYDARLDVYQSTIAALNFLQDLHYKYQDWPTALAAYNYGTGNVDRLIRRNKQKKLPTDYWSLNLPKETRQYVPKLIAYCYLLKNAKKYRLKIAKPAQKSPLISIGMSQYVTIKTLAKAAQMPIKNFKALNPGFLRWAPKPQSKYAILIPQSHSQAFYKNIHSLIEKEAIVWGTHKVESGDTLYDIALLYGIKLKELIAANTFNRKDLIRPGDRLVIPNQALHEQQLEAKHAKGTHRVKSGDTLYDLARLYKVKMNTLMNANKLRKNTIIHPGDLLIIPKMMAK